MRQESLAKDGRMYKDEAQQEANRRMSNKECRIMK